MKLTWEQSKKADKFLKKLCENGGRVGVETIYDSFSNGYEAESICYYLESEGLITLDEVSGDKPLFSAAITKKTKLFITNGGYTVMYNELVKDNRIKIAAFIFSFLTLLVLSLTLLHDFQSKDNEKNESLKTDTIKPTD